MKTVYDSNPLTTGIRGLAAMLTKNPIPTITLSAYMLGAILAGYLVFFAGALSPVLFLLLAVVVAYALVLAAASLALTGATAHNKSMTTKDALAIGKSRVLPLIGLMVALSLMLLAGFILFIIPGLIILARVCLAPLVMFSEDLGPVAAIKRSFALTKGHTIEMIGTVFAAALLTPQSYLLSATGSAGLIGRYQDLIALEKGATPAPRVHRFNYIFTVLAVLAFLAIPIFMTAASFSAIQDARNNSGFNSNDSSIQQDAMYDFDSMYN